MSGCTNLVLLGYTGPWGQEFEWGHVGLIGLLVVLEGVLSIDNALVLGLLAKRLPKKMQPLALTYGLVGAFVFRVLAIATASFLLRWTFVKFLGGGYLLYVALKHFFFESKDETDESVTVDETGAPVLVDAETKAALTADEERIEIEERVPVPVPEEVLAAEKPIEKPWGRKFWMTVLVIELTDIAFAIDSILAAIAMVGSPPPRHAGTCPAPAALGRHCRGNTRCDPDAVCRGALHQASREVPAVRDGGLSAGLRDRAQAPGGLDVQHEGCNEARLPQPSPSGLLGLLDRDARLLLHRVPPEAARGSDRGETRLEAISKLQAGSLIGRDGGLPQRSQRTL